MFNSTNKSQTVKRILASLFVTSVAICSASAANADATATSTHEGSIATACNTIVPIGGALTRISDTEISSAGGLGNFNIKCNTNHTLKFQILHASSSQPVIPELAAYTRNFSLSTTDLRYSTVTSNGFTTFTTNAVNELTFSGLLPTTSAGYDVKVAAKGTIGAAYILPASATPYKIVIEAMLTSN
jgi:hypothetical protein